MTSGFSIPPLHSIAAVSPHLTLVPMPKRVLVKRIVVGIREDGEAIWADDFIIAPDGFPSMTPAEQRAALADAEQQGD